MSYNVEICTAPIAANDSAAWDELDAIIDVKGEVLPLLNKLYKRLTAKYPCLCSLAEDDVDSSVWSDGPLWNNFGHRAAVIGMVYSRVDEALPFVVTEANSLGLFVFDWAGPSIYRP